MSRKKQRRKNQYARFRRSVTSMYPPGVQGRDQSLWASATIAGCFAVRGIKIVEGGKDGLFMSMPSRKTQDGYKDICFPVTEEFRNELKQAVLGAYGEALSMAQASTLQTAPLKIQGRTWSDLRGTENKNRKSMEEIK